MRLLGRPAICYKSIRICCDIALQCIQPARANYFRFNKLLQQQPRLSSSTAQPHSLKDIYLARAPYPGVIEFSKLLGPVSPVGHYEGIFKSDDPYHVLQLLSALHSSDSDIYALGLSHVLHCWYKHASCDGPMNSWLQRNIHIAFIQLLINEKLDEATSDLQNLDTFKELREKLHENCSAVSGNIAAEVCLALLYLGEDKSSPVIQQYYIKSRQHLKRSSLSELGAFSAVNRVFGNRDFFGSNQLLERLNILIQEDEQNWHPVECYCFCSTTFLMMSLTSSHLSFKLLNKLSCLVKRSDLTSEPIHLGTMLRTLRKMYSSARLAEEKMLARDAITALTSKAVDEVDKFDDSNIAEFCGSLKRIRGYNGAIFDAMLARAVTLLNEDLSLKEVINLMTAVDRTASEDIQLMFEDILYKKLKASSPDILLLTDLANTLSSMSTTKQEILEIFQQLLCQHVHRLLEYPGRYQKIMHLIVRRGFHNQETEQAFTTGLLQALEHRPGLVPFGMSSVAAFLLSTSKSALPHSLFNKLLRMIPLWSPADIYRLVLGMNSMRPPIAAALRKQLVELNSCVHMNLLSNQDSLKDLTHDQLYQLMIGLVIHNRNKDPTLTDVLMQTFARFSTNCDETSLQRNVQMFSQANYYHEGAYEAMKQVMLEIYHKLEPDHIRMVLGCLAKAGHPVSPAVLPCARQAYQAYVDQGNLLPALGLIQKVTTLQLFPESELIQIFSLEFLEQLDQYIEAHGSEVAPLERVLMEINRSVVLECPQLDVPWFHEDYCRKTFHNKAPTKNSGSERKVSGEFLTDLEHALAEVLGGDKYLLKSSRSDYWHYLDFECFVDDARRPVRATPKPSQDVIHKASLTPVAILPLVDKDYCYNSRHQTGATQLRIRQLEVMGYQVVQVPNFEWFSMGLSDWPTKVEYIQTKVLGHR